MKVSDVLGNFGGEGRGRDLGLGREKKKAPVASFFFPLAPRRFEDRVCGPRGARATDEGLDACVIGLVSCGRVTHLVLGGITDETLGVGEGDVGRVVRLPWSLAMISTLREARRARRRVSDAFERKMGSITVQRYTLR